MNSKIIYLQASTKKAIIDDINNAYPDLDLKYNGEIEFPLPNGEALHYIGDICIGENPDKTPIMSGMEHCNILINLDNDKILQQK